MPIVFVLTAHPIAEGWATSLAHHGGNITGFLATENEIVSASVSCIEQTGLQATAMPREPSGVPTSISDVPASQRPVCTMSAVIYPVVGDLARLPKWVNRVVLTARR
jgi:hypothetical protein